MPFRVPTVPAVSAAPTTLGAAIAAMVALLVVLPVPAQAADPTVRILDGGLDTLRLVVAPGTTVTWRNDAGDRHRVRSQSGATGFDSGNLEPGESYSVTFRREGTWTYLDERDDDDASYWGTIVVRAGTKGHPTPSTDDPAQPAAATPEVIRMADRVFRPQSITVDAGATVRWRNDDDREHTVTSRAFDSGVLNPGQAFSTRLTSPGTYDYLCAIHPEMQGSITVRGGEEPGRSPTPEPTPNPTPSPVPTTAPAAQAVTVVDFDFRPGTIEVAAGTTVAWSNDGVAPHTVTAADGSWDSGTVAAGDAFQRRFDAPGTYAYLCSFHPTMSGTVRVLASGDGLVGAGSTPSSQGPTASPPPTTTPSAVPSPVRGAAAAGVSGPGSMDPPASTGGPGPRPAGEPMLRLALVAVLCAGAIVAFARLLGASVRRA